MSPNGLTEKEQEDVDNLRVGFNIIKEDTDYMYMASRRVDHNRIWTKKLLRMSFFINILSIFFVFMGLVFVLLKPPPSYYGSTPSGKLYKLENTKKPK